MGLEPPTASWVACGYDSLPSVLGGLLTDGHSIFIKPNLVLPYRYPTDCATTTDIRVTQSLVNELVAAGAGSILVGDCGFKGQWKQTISSTEYSELEGAELRCLMDAPTGKRGELLRSEPGYLSLFGVEVSTLALARDVWISVAKMKVHPLARVSLTIKNLMGTITRGKGMMHPNWSRPVIHKRLRDLYFLLRDRVKLAIVDGVVGMEYSVTCGLPARAGVVVYGDDMFDVDVLSCRLMGIPPEGVEYLRLIGEALDRDVVGMFPDVEPAKIFEEALYYQRIGPWSLPS